MINIEDFKPGTLVELSDSLKYSREENWVHDYSEVVENKIKYGKFIDIHESIHAAMKIEYILRGSPKNVYIHYRDLTIIDKLPAPITKGLFDINNLNI